MSDATQANDEDRLKALENSIMGAEALETPGGGGDDLFSQLHGSELTELKAENERLGGELEDLRVNVSRALAPLLQKFKLANLSGKWKRMKEARQSSADASIFVCVDQFARFVESGDIENLKTAITEVIRLLDERLQAEGAERGAEKRVKQLRADLRQMILLAGRYAVRHTA